jgi:hypothetical protein
MGSRDGPPQRPALGGFCDLQAPPSAGTSGRRLSVPPHRYASRAPSQLSLRVAAHGRHRRGRHVPACGDGALHNGSGLRSARKQRRAPPRDMRSTAGAAAAGPAMRHAGPIPPELGASSKPLLCTGAKPLHDGGRAAAIRAINTPAPSKWAFHPLTYSGLNCGAGACCFLNNDMCVPLAHSAASTTLLRPVPCTADGVEDCGNRLRKQDSFARLRYLATRLRLGDCGFARLRWRVVRGRRRRRLTTIAGRLR